jgi:DNA-binding NarL/FixJ family response regulator
MRVVIVDDDRLVGISLKTIIEAEEGMDVAGIGYNGKDAVALYNKLFPDILLMDIRMDTMTGLEAGESILLKHKDARILFLTTFADDEYIIRALKMGAKGYILKQNFESIVPSIKAVCAGQSVFGEYIVARIPGLIGGSRRSGFSDFGITEKESEIAVLVAEGLSNKEIAAKLFLSEGTVRNSLSAILEKLDLRSRTQLAVFYYKNISAE